MDKQYVVSAGVLQAVMLYLERQPFKDVAVLINELSQSKEASVINANNGTDS